MIRTRDGRVLACVSYSHELKLIINFACQAGICLWQIMLGNRSFSELCTVKRYVNRTLMTRQSRNSKEDSDKKTSSVKEMHIVDCHQYNGKFNEA